MSHFPRIEHLNDLRQHIEGNSQIRIKQCETTGHTVVCYMLQDEDTFAGDNEQFARECRGITFDETGAISSRTMHKFFNVGEREDTQPWMIDWARVVRVMDKRDGSMVTPVPVRGWRDKVSGTFKFKTKKSFTTPEAALADQVAAATPGGREWIERLLRDGFTPTFEITSPRFPIVLRYEKDELTLLQIRENSTGRYITSLGEGGKFTKDCPFPIVQNIIDEFDDEVIIDIYKRFGKQNHNQVSWNKLEEAAKTRTGVEGWIVQLDDGEMYKVKTQWYIDLHHSVTFTRWRDIARTVCADGGDDLKAAFALVGRSIEPILQVERKIRATIEWNTLTVAAMVEGGRSRGWTVKEMAEKYKGNPLFGVLMRAYRDYEINWIEHYQKHHLEEDWGLEVVA